VFSTYVRIVKSSQTDAHKMITVLGMLVTLDRNKDSIPKES